MEEPSIKIYLTTSDGLGYYYGILQPNGSYVLPAPTATPTPILTLPKGWMDTQIEWNRDNTFLGIFTTQSQTFKFVEDARGILLNLYYATGGGIQAECMMRVDVFQDVFTGYVTTYECEIDFSKASDQKYQGNTGDIGNPPKQGEFSVPTLNARLNELWMAYGDTQFNIPMWTTPDGGATWLTDANVVWHTGIKLLYQASFESAATLENPLVYTVSPFPPYSTAGQQLNGWNKGSGYAFGDGYHIVLPMAPFSIVQNNGATTFIGNDILTPFLILNSQTPGPANFASENSFAGTNHSEPFSRNNYSLKNLLPNTPTGGLDMFGSAKWTCIHPTSGVIQGIDQPGGAGGYMSFVLFEINNDNNPTVVASKYVNPQELLRINFPTTAGIYFPTSADLDNTSNALPITINLSKCYVIGIICDNTAGYGGSNYCSFIISSLTVSIRSKYDSGLSGVPIPSPSFPGSPIMGFKADQLLSKLVPMLNSVQTDQFGFPVIPAGTPYTGVSTFLATDAIVYDNSPQRTLFFSSNALQLLQGYPFISMSVNQLAKFCFNTWGCGLAIKGNTIEIEDLAHYFQNVMICDLGENVAFMKVEPLTEIMNCELQTGYSSQDTNNDFGVDIYAKELDFTTPLSKVPGTTLSIINSIIADMYAMEKRRAQQVSSAIPTSGNGQSNGNETYVVEFDPTMTYAPGVTVPYPNSTTGTGKGFAPPLVKQFSGAQSSNVLLGDYIYGLFYPDTALNLGLTPIKNLYRLGSYLRSMLDGQDSENLVFRKIYQMLYNNVSQLIPGIITNNLYGTGGMAIQECTDILISDLSRTQLFRPFKITVRTIGAVNTWKIMNLNPNGYFQWMWKGDLWKGYVSKISQNIALNNPNDFIFWAHESVTNAMLINA